MHVLYTAPSFFSSSRFPKLLLKNSPFGFQIASERHPRPKRLATIREHWRCDRDARAIGDTRDRNGATTSLGGPELLQRAGIRQRIPTSAYPQEQGNQLPKRSQNLLFLSIFWNKDFDRFLNGKKNFRNYDGYKIFAHFF